MAGIEQGGVIKFGDAGMAVVRSMEIRQAKHEYTTISLELMVPGSFGFSDVGKLDLSKLFQSPAVNKAINDEIQTQMRKITFDDQ